MDPRLEFTFQLLIDGTGLPRSDIMDHVFEGNMVSEGSGRRGLREASGGKSAAQAGHRAAPGMLTYLLFTLPWPCAMAVCAAAGRDQPAVPAPHAQQAAVVLPGGRGRRGRAAGGRGRPRAPGP